MEDLDGVTLVELEKMEEEITIEVMMDKIQQGYVDGIEKVEAYRETLRRDDIPAVVKETITHDIRRFYQYYGLE